MFSALPIFEAQQDHDEEELKHNDQLLTAIEALSDGWMGLVG